MKCKDLFLSYLTACPDCQSVLFGHGGGDIIIFYYPFGNIQTHTQYQYVIHLQEEQWLITSYAML